MGLSNGRQLACWLSFCLPEFLLERSYENVLRSLFFSIAFFLSRSTRMANFPTISTAMMKITPVGCGLYAALATRTNKTWSCFNTATTSTTGRCETYPRVLSFSCGITITIPSSSEYRSVYAMSPDVRANRTRKCPRKRCVINNNNAIISF